MIAVKNREIERVIQIVTIIGNLIRQVGDLRLEGERGLALTFPQTLQHLESQIEPGEIRIRMFQQLDHAQALAVVLKASVLPHAFRQHLLARMPKGRMPEIMRQRDRLRQILVQRQRPRDRAADRGHFNCVR